MPLGETASTVIAFQLDEGELTTIPGKADEIGFASFPPEFAVPVDQRLGIHASAASYELIITRQAGSHSVSWKDEIMAAPGFGQADRLRELMNPIVNTLDSHREFQVLPRPEAACL
jgi:hypothetical protein